MLLGFGEKMPIAVEGGLDRSVAELALNEFGVEKYFHTFALLTESRFAGLLSNRAATAALKLRGCYGGAAKNYSRFRRTLSEFRI